VNGFEVLVPIFGILLVLVPVTGLTLILTARFALKPMTETIAKALRESGFAAGSGGVDRLQELTEQVQLLTDEVARLREAQEFDRTLIGGRGEGRD
jgi:hypothetical protein